MISVGIVGASDSNAGELLRLLVNHPDVNLVKLCDNINQGKSIVDIHHGLIGETNLSVSPIEELENVDVLFISLDTQEAKEFLSDYIIPDDQFIIDMSGYAREYCDTKFVYGLSELNRKPLVRGAHLATIPTPVASAILVSLIPLIINNISTTDIIVNVEGGVDSLSGIESEVKEQLQKLQKEFNSNININLSEQEHRRGIRVETSLTTNVPFDEIFRLYEDYYDDHNMTYILRGRKDYKEVEGSDKCLVSLIDKSNGQLVIDTIADAHLRGGAGDAVHVMNLFCGLHEKIGLTLKVNNF